MIAQRSPQFRSAAGSVLRWCAVYTRGLEPAVAAARQDEIASDLHEHAVWASSQGMSGRRLAWSVRARAILGAAADLSWRRQQARSAAASVRFALRVNAAILSAVLTLAVGLTAVGVFTLVRVGRALAIDDIGYAPRAAVTIGALTVVALLAGILLLRRRSRPWAALVLMIPAVFMFQLAGSVLWRVSASTVVAFHHAPWWEITALIAGMSLAMLSGAAAFHWWGAARRGRPVFRKDHARD